MMNGTVVELGFDSLNGCNINKVKGLTIQIYKNDIQNKYLY